MKSLLQAFLISLAFISLSSSAVAQEGASPLLTASFDQVPFEQFFRELEAKTSFYFHYDPQQLDSLYVTGSFEQAPLDLVLKQVLSGTDLQYSIDTSTGSVFISRGQKVITDLPFGFYQRKQDNKEEKNTQVVDYFEEKGDKPWLKRKKLYEIGQKTRTISAGNARISGKVRNAQSGEQVIGATVMIEDPMIGAITDAFGNYTLTIPKGHHSLKVRSVGMISEAYNIMVYSDGKMDIELIENVDQLKTVEISAERQKNVTQTQMGIEKLDVKAIRQVPAIMGEPDVLRVVLTLPGVKTVGEASTGFNVRGGSVDQNLILFGEATIFNPSHLFGFFSAFNSDVLDGVELYKSSIPAQYGGRLSSVLKISPRWGNKKKFEGKAGIGLLTSRLSLEGPIVKDRTSFIIGGRGTYSNWLLNLLDNEKYKNSKASFYDLNLNLTHEINEKSNLYFTGYISQDQFKLGSDTLFGYNNKTASLKWKSTLSRKLIGEFSSSLSQYSYSVSSESEPVNAYRLSFGISQMNGQAAFIYSLNPNHTLNFGLSGVHYKVQPGSFQPIGANSQVSADVLEPEQALESAFYLEDQFDVFGKLTLNVSLRYSLYNYLGAKNVITYASGLPREEVNMIDTLSYPKGKFINTYHGPEYRLSARYLFSPSFSVKAGYNTLRQYIHMLSNSTAVSPTDIWKLSDPNIRPQFGEQYSLGLYKNMRQGTIETSIEGYYKNIHNYLDYKGGATLIMNHAIETDVVSTKGKAYGAEFMLKKLSGKLNGWVSYTYSRVLLRQDDPSAGELINRGDWYPANYDKPHDFSLTGNYKFSHRVSASLNVAYSTGRPVTLPIAKYWYAGAQRVLYADRNSYRIPDYFRTDFALNIEGNHKLKQLTHNSWTFGVYNLTGRKNAYSTYFISENGSINGYKLSIFGSAIPFINYNIRF